MSCSGSFKFRRGIRVCSHAMNLLGTAIVERWPWRTSAQSSNCFDFLMAASKTGSARRLRNSISTLEFHRLSGR